MSRKRKVSPEAAKRLATVFIAIVLIIIVAIIYVISSIVEKYTPTDERADLYEYFNMNSENQEEVAIIMQNEKLEEKARLIDDKVYLEYEMIYSMLNKRFYWDENENVLLYTTPDDVITAAVGSKDYYVTKEKYTEDYVIVKVEGNHAYVALDYVQKYTNIEFEVFKEPNRVHITNVWNEVKLADVRKDDYVRVKGGIKSKILTDLKKGAEVEVLETGEEWSKVRTEDAFIGYIKNKYLENERQEVRTRAFAEPVYTNISKDYEINLVWHQVTSYEANDSLLTSLADTKGVNTISPTWFSLADNEGNISSLAETNYVQHAHQLGMEVWALVDNFNDDVSTYDVLSYTSKRDRLTNQLIAAAIEYDLDGINIDFEELKSGEGRHFVQFIRELSVKCRRNGIVLSIDNYVPTASSELYDRTEQGIVADYIIIMGYDEHFAGSEEAGSVASIGFVEDGIVNTMAQVPKEKIINGVPFYTRLWVKTPKTQEQIDGENESTEFIPYNLTSEIYSMKNSLKLISAYELRVQWDEAAGQNYAVFSKDGIDYEIWFEDAASIEEKMKLIDKYEIAGVACWKLGLESDDIWDTIIKYIN